MRKKNKPKEMEMMNILRRDPKLSSGGYVKKVKELARQKLIGAIENG